MFDPPLQLIFRQFTGFAKTNDPRHVLGRGAAVTLLSPTPKKRNHARSLSNVQGPHPLGPVELMGGHRKKIYPKLIHIHLDLPRCLNRIRVEIDVFPFHDL